MFTWRYLGIVPRKLRNNSKGRGCLVIQTASLGRMNWCRREVSSECELVEAALASGPPDEWSRCARGDRITAIWQNDGTGWRLSALIGFPDEQTLHDLVEETPQILPLARDPRFVVVGKEVGLGNGYADIVAIEPSGRLAVVEFKLSRSAEARGAVVTQVLTYAAHLKGLSPEAVERDVLGRRILKRRE